MKQFGWQVVGCSMPAAAMHRQERHGHQELITALAGQRASWW